MQEGRRIKYSPRQTEIRDSVLKALNRLGCEISTNSFGYDRFKYRNSKFVIKYGDNIFVILFFTDIKPIIGHTQEYYNVFEAMNYANGHPGPNFVLAGPFNGDQYQIAARREAVMMPDTEISEKFMEGFLNDFFEALRIFNIGYYFHVGDNEAENEPGNERRDRQWEDLVNSLYDSAEVSDLITRQEVVNPMKQEEDLPDTCGLMFRTLVNIGCQPTKNEDGTITVFYQGENFYMEFYGRHAKIWDLGWTYVGIFS